jgi:uncharacterized protein
MNKNKNILKIKTDSDKKFFLNKKNGKWVLSENLNKKTLEYLLQDLDKNQKFLGTSMVVLNVSNICNLNCIYCHVKEVKDTKTRMSSEVGRKAIDRVFELPEKNRLVVFHGREPSTNFPLIKDLVEYCKEKGKIEFCVQSNGTLFDKEQLKYFEKEKIGIGISLDGLEKHQSINRPSKNHESSYQKIINNLNEIKKIQKGLSIITVVSKYNVSDLEEITRDLEEKVVSSVSFSPMYPNKDSYSECPDQTELSEKMRGIFNNYLERTIKDENPIRILNLRDVTRIFFRNNFTSNCVKCSGNNIHPLMAIDVNGDIYPCDFFWGRKKYKVGNIFQDSLIESLNSRKNFRITRTTKKIEECSSCDWERFCGAGCPGSSVLEGKGIANKSYYCEYNKNMFEYVAKKLPLFHEKRILDKILAE